MAQYKYLIQRFIGGMNADIDPAAIDLTKQQDQVVDIVSTVVNGVFERGLFRSRPQLSTPANTVSIPSNNLVYAVSKLPFPSNGAVATYYIGGIALTFDTGSSTYKLWRLNAESVVAPLLNVVEITGPGITAAGWDNLWFSNCVCNGVVLIAGYKGGLIRWDPTTTVYTIIANAKWAFVTKQNSRAVGAYLTTSALTDPVTVGASKSGDEGVWVATSIEAYQNVISDIPDAITGVGVAKGILVIPRTFGFHLGYPTGTFPAIYNFTQHSDDAIGCSNPATFCIYKNVCYFVSTNGIHTFDLVDVEDIGEGVYEEVLDLLTALGGTLRGFISASYKNDYQPTYNLYIDIPSTSVSANSIPLWQYNIRERKWTRWLTNEPSGSYSSLWMPFYYRATTGIGFSIPITSTVVQLGRKPSVTAQFKYTKELFGNGSESFVTAFTTGKLTISAPVFEATITRIMLVYTCNASSPPEFSITIDSTLNSTTTSLTRSGIVGTGNSLGSTPAKWIRQWVGNFCAVGQMFQVSVAATTNANNVLFKEMIIEFTDTSKERA